MKNEFSLESTSEGIIRYRTKLIIATILLIMILVIDTIYMMMFVSSKDVTDIIHMFYSLTLIAIIYFSCRLYFKISNNKVVAFISPLIMLILSSIFLGIGMFIVIIYLLVESKKSYKSNTNGYTTNELYTEDFSVISASVLNIDNNDILDLDIKSKLSIIEDLRMEGIINDNEYESKRTKIINNL